MKLLNEKIIFAFIIIIVCNLIFLPKTYATSNLSISELISAAKDFTTKGQPVKNVIDQYKLQGSSNYVFKILTVIAICTALIVGAVLGIQYLLASAEGKAEIAEKLMAYLVGCFIAFAAFTIWSLAVQLGQNIFE